MPVVVIQPEGIRASVSYGTRLIDVLNEAGISIENVCGGRGVCKKCLVEVLEGGLSEPTVSEAELVKASQKFRLACQARVVENIVVKILDLSRRLKGKILEYGYAPDFEFLPVLKIVSVKLEEPSLRNQRSDAERLTNALKVGFVDNMLLRILPSKLRRLNWSIDAIVYENEVLDVREHSACPLWRCRRRWHNHNRSLPS
jgi:uncharacterized 2Fe-2S/4Fe-4S cluster protein (DUF4445 family)